ncbi:hypothetical protein NMG60_11003233 [Bertholletia excelsa]
MAFFLENFAYSFGLVYLAIFSLSHAYGEGLYASESCDLFTGSWVSDNTYPLYDSSKCPFVSKPWNCQTRPDKMFLKYRWQPDGCTLPRFNGTDFLQRFRSKKILFVGDSLGNNQYQSLACLLHSTVPATNYTFSGVGDLSTFTIPDYGITISRITNHFLVDLVEEKGVGRVLKLDSLSPAQWTADILIFDTYHWWLHSGGLQPWDYVEVEGKLFKDLNRMVAYKIALTTWAKWVDATIDPLKTRVFFQGISAFHNRGDTWGAPAEQSCKGQTTLIPGSKFPGEHYDGEKVVKSVLATIKKPVTLLDITLLTQLRKDAHPAQYTDGSVSLDCSHWCLAGVPDTWNQLLYTLLIQK